MLRIGLLGINHQLAALRLRERIAKSAHALFLRGTDAPSILLSTCNRTEIYFSSDDLAASQSELLAGLREEIDEPFDHKLYSFFGLDAFHHLAQVTAGLNSAIIGESEIQRQVKLAYEEAARTQRLPSELHYIFQKSLRIGKQVRTHYPVRGQMADLESAILRSGRELFPDLSERRLLFIGASEINARVLHHFKRSEVGEIALCNRSLDRALEWAGAKRIDVCDWQRLGSWVEYDLVVVGTRFPDLLLSERELPDDGRRRLVVDLSVPRNVDPRMGLREGVTLLNIDQIDQMVERGRSLKAVQLREMEEFVSNSVVHQTRGYRRNFALTRLQIVAAS